MLSGPGQFQAYQLFLAEAQELHPQIDEGLVQFAHSLEPSILQKIRREIHRLHQGAQALGIKDLELLSAALHLTLSTDLEHKLVEYIAIPQKLLELLQSCSEGWQLSLQNDSPILNTPVKTEQQIWVLHSLLPKALEMFEFTLTQSLPKDTRYQLLLTQVKCLQYWHHLHTLPEIDTIAQAALKTLLSSPQSDSAIAPVALAGFQVAYHTALARITPAISTQSIPENLSPTFSPARDEIKHLNIAQYLVGIACQTVFCIATDSITEIVLPQPEQQQLDPNLPTFLWNGNPLPLLDLMDLWNPQSSDSDRNPKYTNDLILILHQQNIPVALALAFDRLIVDTSIEIAPAKDSPTPHSYGWTHIAGNWLQVIDVNLLLEQYILKQLPTKEPEKASLPVPILPLPVVHPISQPINTEHPEANNLEPQSSQPPSSSQTILIVDDSRTVREILSVTLVKAGYHVLQAQSGQEAIAHLQESTPIHLTICDLEMSNLNGFEFLRHRLQKDDWLNIPVLILSSHTSSEYQQLAQKLGAADYCTIPYDPPILLNKIAKLLQQET